METGSAENHIEGGYLRTGVSTLPDIAKDATDRNRTSPFAFTGNKFEFRMVGSADSVAGSTTILNAIVAEAFCEAADLLEKSDHFELAVHDLIKKNMTEHKRILFDGDGYSQNWVEEAKKRGLPNIPSTIEAAEVLTTRKSVELFERFRIFTRTELESRQEITYETYAKTINIEALTMIDMASRQIIPACMKYEKDLADTIIAVQKAGAVFNAETEKLQKIADEIDLAQQALDHLRELETKASAFPDGKERAFFYKDVVVPAMSELRAPCDRLECIVNKDAWPFPTYEDLMFEI